MRGGPTLAACLARHKGQPRGLRSEEAVNSAGSLGVLDVFMGEVWTGRTARRQSAC